MIKTHLTSKQVEQMRKILNACLRSEKFDLVYLITNKKSPYHRGWGYIAKKVGINPDGAEHGHDNKGFYIEGHPLVDKAITIRSQLMNGQGGDTDDSE